MRPFLFILPSASTPLVSISNTHPTLTLNETEVKRLVKHVCKEENVTLDELSIVLAPHDMVLELNRTYLNHDYLTDVLSFSLTEEENVVDGEIYVDLDTAQERHEEFNVTFELEAYRYVVHGLLHLMGYEDNTPELKAGMRELEDKYLKGIIES